MRTLFGTTLLTLLMFSGAAPAQDEGGAPSIRDVHDAYNEGVRTKRWEKCREVGQAFMKANPKDFTAAWLLANSYVNEGNPSAALPWFQKASDNDPAHFMAAFETGVTFMRYKDSDPKAMEKAMPYLQRAIDARRAPEPKGLSTDENDQKMRDFLLGPAMIEAYAEREQWDKCKELSQQEISKEPLCSIPCYWLGHFAEEDGDRARAIDLYKKGAAVKLEAPFSSVFHKWGVEDKRSECNQRASFLDATTVRYGTVSMEGLKFVNDEQTVEMMLPHPKLLRLKKNERYPWLYLFPPHEAKAGSVITHVITAACTSNRVTADHEVVVYVNVAPHTVNMNANNGGGSAKASEPENFAELLFSDNTHRDAAVDLKEVKKIRKSSWGRGYKGYEWSYTCINKKAQDQYDSNPRGYRKPVPWEHHWYLAKGKGVTFWVEIQSQEGFWKKRQKEILFMLSQLKMPD